MQKNTEQEGFGQRLKNTIRERGLTQREFAKAIGVTDQMISLYINGKSKMSAKTLAKAAAVLNTSIEYLVLKTDADMPNRLVAYASRFSSKVSENDKKRSISFRCTTMGKMLEAQGVKRQDYVTIGNSDYMAYQSGIERIWVDTNGVSLSNDELFHQIRENPEASEHWCELTYGGRSIKLNEDDYNFWLLSMWNSINLQLQARFMVPLPLLNEIPETDMSMALRGLRKETEDN